jgi:hypothetical protein
VPQAIDLGPPCPLEHRKELPMRGTTEKVRTWRRDGFVLELWDTHRPTGTGYLGHTRLAYRLSDRGRVIFAGDDFVPPLGVAIDSDDCVAALLFGLTLMPWEVKDDFFDGYTTTQREWLESGRAEELRGIISLVVDDQ